MNNFSFYRSEFTNNFSFYRSQKIRIFFHFIGVILIFMPPPPPKKEQKAPDQWRQDDGADHAGRDGQTVQRGRQGGADQAGQDGRQAVQPAAPAGKKAIKKPPIGGLSYGALMLLIAYKFARKRRRKYSPMLARL